MQILDQYYNTYQVYKECQLNGLHTD